MKRKLHFRSVVSLANTKLSVRTAAIVIASSTLVSALLGIFRDRWLNTMYYDTYPAGLDAYTAAFTVPDFLFFIITSGALAVTFVPVFNQRLVNGNKKSAWELSTSTLNFLALLSFIASIFIMIFADPLVRYVVAPGLNESAMSLAINMMRVIAINPFLFSISTVLASMQQAVGRFIFYSLAPALYNVGIITGILVFTNGINIFGVQLFEGGIMGVAIGVVFGALLQLATSIIGLVGLGFDYNFKIHWRNQGFRKVLKLLPSRSADQGIDYVMSIINTNLASRMGEQSIRAFQQASSLHSMPVNLIGVAISTAFFPRLSEEAGRGDDVKFRGTYRAALSTIILISMPIAIIAFFTRGYVVNFIKNGGDPKIASVLGAFIIAIITQSMYHIVARGFYAKQNAKVPLIVSVAAFVVQIAAAVLLSMWGFGPEGLAYATSISAVFEVGVLILVQNHEGKLLDREFWRTTLKVIIASSIAGVASWVLTKLLPLRATDNSFFSTFPKFFLIAGSSLILYIVVCWLLKIQEVQPLIDKITKVLFRNVKAAPKDKDNSSED
ncbi:murein biosynthesis integral membrane protein MurJ [Candidatus Saccharibacteria bacterium]|nr:murein biosynthesis integral membrane protein MurJ [Candidatus Saccharibacteria bacterium]